ncbi:MAG: hypothetical protein IPL78_33510 [Chloroflexi bacterium]|nr:hypothetical protein [Chloroflexota bacterium]
MSSGSITIVDPHSGTGGGEAINLASGAGTKSFTGGTFFIGDGSSTTAGSTDGFDIITGGLTLPNLTINNQGGGTNRFARLATNPLTLNGSLTIENGGELQANSQNITLAGNWANSGTFTSGTQTTTFNGSTAQTISCSSATAFSTLVINNGSALSSSLIPTSYSGGSCH